MMMNAHQEATTESMPSSRPDRTRPEDHLGLVRRVVNQLHPFSEDEGDGMYSDGVLGLLSAFDQWDASRGIQRSTYLAHRIRGAILDGRRKRDPLSRQARSNMRVIETARIRLTTALGRTPRDCEVLDASALGEKRYRRTLAASRASKPDSLDMVIGSAAVGATVMDLLFVEEPDDDGYERECERTDAGLQARVLLDRLCGQARHVVVRHFLRGESQTEIARDLDVTGSRVSQILAKAIRTMRSPDAPQPRRVHGKATRAVRQRKVTVMTEPATESARSYLARRFEARLSELGLDRTPHAMTAFRFGLDGGSKVGAFALATGVTRRSWSRRLTSRDLAGPQHWIMAGRIVWWLYLLEHRYTTVRAMAKAIGVGEYDISHACYAATGMRPRAMVEVCSRVASPSPVADAMFTYLTEQQAA